jgi:GNAT superfamily N-acetyltransferase
MNSALNHYSIRPADTTDIEAIAHHRVMIFQDMGLLPDGEAEALLSATIPWLRDLFAKQEYIGWLVQDKEEVVAGGGIQLREKGPIPNCCRLGRWGHILNIYVVPAHRRRGLARLIIQQAIHWSKANQLDLLTLTASSEGRPLYEALGFTSSADMQLSAEKQR